LPIWTTRVVLASLTSFALLTGAAGVAAAQENAATLTNEAAPAPADDNEAPPLVESDLTVAAECQRGEQEVPSIAGDGTGEVGVFLRTPQRGDAEFTAKVGDLDAQSMVFNGDLGGYVAVFRGVAHGVYSVLVTGTDGTSLISEADLEGCSDEVPPADKLDVWVKCVDGGTGQITIQVYNPSTKRSRHVTIQVNDQDLPPYEDVPLSPESVARITEMASDGTYKITLLKRGKEIDSKTVTVACTSTTETSSTTTESSTTESSTTESSTTTESSSTETTTTPPAQGGTVPSGGGGLATTGAAVGGLAVLGALAVLLGAALVLTGRRRRKAA
jgi:hypothetical protein